jgi:hypothetical protein
MKVSHRTWDGRLGKGVEGGNVTSPRGLVGSQLQQQLTSRRVGQESRGGSREGEREGNIYSLCITMQCRNTMHYPLSNMLN